jgi:hypothetical protein
MLNYVPGRVIVSVDLEAKNWHTFENGTKIRRERQFNELNRRITEPTNAVVISGENLSPGSHILIHPNAPSDTNQIHNYRQLSGEVTGSDIRYYSIPEEMCFAWHSGQQWETIAPYQTALRVFVPYPGVIQGVEPTMLKDTLYVTSGNLKGMVVATLKACDYQIVFQDTNGREGNLIRFRPEGDEKASREPEAIAILRDETMKVNSGEYLVGISISDAKPIVTEPTKRKKRRQRKYLMPK